MATPYPRSSFVTTSVVIVPGVLPPVPPQLGSRSPAAAWAIWGAANNSTHATAVGTMRCMGTQAVWAPEQAKRNRTASYDRPNGHINSQARGVECRRPWADDRAAGTGR